MFVGIYFADLKLLFSVLLLQFPVGCRFLFLSLPFLFPLFASSSFIFLMKNDKAQTKFSQKKREVPQFYHIILEAVKLTPHGPVKAFKLMYT